MGTTMRNGTGAFRPEFKATPMKAEADAFLAVLKANIHREPTRGNREYMSFVPNPDAYPTLHEIKEILEGFIE